MTTSRNPLPWSKLFRLRFGQLRLLAELSDTGSIRRAAVALNMSQPAVSKALKELELLLGVSLYHRTVQGVNPTLAGVTATRGARLLLSELELLAYEVRTVSENEVLSLRLGISPYLGPSVVPGLLARLSKSVDLVNIYIEEMWASALLDSIAQGNLDVVLLMCAPEMVTALDNPTLIHDYLCQEEFAIVASPDHPLASKATVTLDDLTEERWILGKKPSLFRRAFDDAFLHAGFRPPVPWMEATTIPTITEAVIAGFGISGLSERSVSVAVSSGRLKVLKLNVPIRLPPIVVVYRRLMTEHPRLSVLIDAIRQELSPSI